MRLYNKEYSKQEILRYIGNINQVAGVERSTFDDGKARGMRVARVYTGTGFEYSVLFDRGMDIGDARIKGIPISFKSSVGYSSPYLYEEHDAGFLRSFGGGLLTTCGLTYMGGPCVDGGEKLGLHGRATSIPADETYGYGKWAGDEYIMSVGGVVWQNRFDGENVVLTRTITSAAGKSSLKIHDNIENCGYKSQPFMMLYHCNFGYPFISEDSTFSHSNSTAVEPKNEIAEAALGNYSAFGSPDDDFKPQVFYHRLQSDRSDTAEARLTNIKFGYEAYIAYDTTHLPFLVQWKHLCAGEYVCGIEPSTWYGHGRNVARERNDLKMIEAGESIDIEIEIGVREIV